MLKCGIDLFTSPSDKELVELEPEPMGRFSLPPNFVSVSAEPQSKCDGHVCTIF